MSIETDIQSALYEHLRTATGDLASVPRAAPLVDYTPSAGTTYLDVRPILRAEPRKLGVSFYSATERRGVFQIDVVTPDNKGEPPGLRIAGLVVARFSIGTKLVAGSYRLLLDKEPTVAAAVKDAPWVRFPVSIPYLVIT